MENNNRQTILDAAGCLKKYVVGLELMDKNIVGNIIGVVQNIPGYLCNAQIPFTFLIGLDYSDKFIAEIGCWHGRTTTALVLGSQYSAKLFCVDTFLGSEEHQAELNGRNFRQDFENTLAKFSLTQNVVVVEKASSEAAASVENESFDMVWIDAAHDYDNVCLDIRSWTPKLKTGGLICGHDYPHPNDPNGGFEDLKRSVNQLVRDSDKFRSFGHFAGIWGAIKN